MKQGIHPEYNKIEVVCSCGNKFTTRSTAGKNLHLEVCANCHPFYTGKQKIMDTAGRVDRFKQKYGAKGQGVTPVQPAGSAPKAAAPVKAKAAAVKKAPAKKAPAKKEAKPDTKSTEE